MSTRPRQTEVLLLWRLPPSSCYTHRLAAIPLADRHLLLSSMPTSPLAEIRGDDRVREVLRGLEYRLQLAPGPGGYLDLPPGGEEILLWYMTPAHMAAE